MEAIKIYSTFPPSFKKVGGGGGGGEAAGVRTMEPICVYKQLIKKY